VNDAGVSGTPFLRGVIWFSRWDPAGCEIIRSEKMSGTKRAGRTELATLL
jgi:hypothetical protein